MSQASDFFQRVNQVLRGWGYDVEEQEGCWGRSNGSSWAAGIPRAHTNHHFVIPLSAPFMSGVNNVTYGDSTLQGPKCNYYGGVDPTTGKKRIRFIAVGTANHPGQGNTTNRDRVLNDIEPIGWAATHGISDNWSGATTVYAGTELHHPGDSTPWPPGLIEIARDINAAMCIVGGWTWKRCHMHAEHSSRKIDMSFHTVNGGFDLRQLIKGRLEGGVILPTPPEPTEEDDFMALFDSKEDFKQWVAYGFEHALRSGTVDDEFLLAPIIAKLTEIQGNVNVIGARTQEHIPNGGEEHPYGLSDKDFLSTQISDLTKLVYDIQRIVKGEPEPTPPSQ